MTNLDKLIERSKRNGMASAMLLTNDKCREKGIDPIFTLDEISNIIESCENLVLDNEDYSEVEEANQRVLSGE